jgi:hypothetical protein
MKKIINILAILSFLSICINATTVYEDAEDGTVIHIDRKDNIANILIIFFIVVPFCCF